MRGVLAALSVAVAVGASAAAAGAATTTPGRAPVGPAVLSGTAVQYLGDAQAEDAAVERFDVSSQTWSARTPTRAVAEVAAPLAVAMARVRHQLVTQHWPAALRPDVAELARRLVAPERDLRSPPLASAQVPGWLAVYRRDAGRVEPVANQIRRQIGLARRD
ncbi:MAG TPA: hypothetical protein VKG43_08755 [Acidimicrobiales bacterium]|nr:hypothetical protein [Acidimicrobiales bacterium]